MAEAVAFEVLNTFHRGLILLSRMSRGLNNVTGIEGPNIARPIFALPVKDDCPDLFGLVPFRVDGCRSCPQIKFEKCSIGLEELG